NGVGERVIIVDGTATPHYWGYDGPRLVFDKDRSGTSLAYYRHDASPQNFLGSLIEYVSTDASVSSYPGFDERGSVKQLQVLGASNSSFEYDAYGVSLGAADATGGRLRFLSPSLVRPNTTAQEYYLGSLCIPKIGICVPGWLIPAG